MKVGLPLMKNVLISLSKSLLIPLGLTAAASVADPRIFGMLLGTLGASLLGNVAK